MQQKVRAFSVKASDEDGLLSATAVPVTVNVASPASKLVFTAQPTGAAVGVFVDSLAAYFLLGSSAGFT